MIVGLVMQRATRMFCVCCGLSGYTVFFISQMARFSEGGGGEQVAVFKSCVFILSANWSEIFLILGRIQRVTIVNVHKSSRKILVILVGF
jgi:hypothetical protein